MDYKSAFEILEIDTSEVGYKDINLKFVKRKYHKMALKNHPDKNGNTPESTEKFKRIKEAYDYLKREMKYLNPGDFANELEKEDDKSSQVPVYFDILQVFMKTFFEGKYNEIISKIINNVVTGFDQVKMKLTVKLFENLDKETSLNIYTFLSKYRFILHLSQDILEEVREIVMKKYENVQMYKLNPSLRDLIDNNVYKLYIDEQLFLVPLWYNELYFDNSNGEIIVICEPELPETVKIDDDNNIYVERKIDIRNELPELLINNEDIEIVIGEKKFYISLSELNMKREQYYRLRGQGLTKVNEDDMYDVSKKSDIIVKILLA